jgi:hypothetical protein
MSITYQVNFTDEVATGKTAVVVTPGEANGPGNIHSDTSLVLYGQGHLKYGEGINENLIRLLENFASPTAPVNPTAGQLWFDYSVNALKLYDKTGVWTVASGVTAEATPPTPPQLGQIWFDPATLTMFYWNGTQWVAVIGDSGSIDARNHPISNLAEPIVPSDAATKNYVDTTAVAKAGDTMTGLLVLSGSPLINNHAATKQYIDDLISAVASGGGTGPLAMDHYSTVASAGQTIVGLPFNYVQGTFTLQVYVSGVKQYPVDSYTESSITTITFLTPLNAGDKVEVTKIKSGDGVYLPLSGGTLTGTLVLQGDPLVALGAATKQYVDNKVNTSLLPYATTTYVDTTGKWFGSSKFVSTASPTVGQGVDGDFWFKYI